MKTAVTTTPATTLHGFWNNLPQPFFALAPMEAVTDVVFRHVIAKAGRPDVFFTEFTNTASYCSTKGKHSTKSRLTFTADEKPIVAQIWGVKPDDFRQMAHGLIEVGFSGIDINMGCPDKAVVKGGAGSGLIKTPSLAVEIIQATKEAGLPVSVKTRLGDINADEWHDWLSLIFQQNIANLTIHLRTRKEMSKVKAHYEYIPDIIKLRDTIAPNTLVTINGDIQDRQHGELLTQTYPGINGLMIGRGVFTNPYAFTAGYQPTRAEIIKLLRYHLDLFDSYNSYGSYSRDENGDENKASNSDSDNTTAEPSKPFDTLKRFFKIYIRDIQGAAELRDALMHTKSTHEVRVLLESRNL